MELTKNHPERRWEIVYGAYTGMEAHAVDLIQAAVKRYVPYIISLYTAPTGKANVLYIGTKESNPHIAGLLADVDLPEHGTYIKVFGQAEEQTVVIAGADAASCYYAAVEFTDDYLPSARRKPVGHPFFQTPFVDALPEYEHAAAPAVLQRGLWTWGHVIFDYRSYIRNMARLKLNRITVWNDFAPINGKEFVEYAHSWGIRVIWGYSWIWDEKPDEVIHNPETRAQWKEKILRQYKEDYAPLGGDGIYFQTFTETSDQTLDGKNRAACAVEWVNEVASELLAVYPDLLIEFGLHATSVRNDLNEIAKTDPRVSIIWEDCGSFPYSYGAQATSTLEETSAFSGKIASLRGGKGFGAVLKGMSWLDWGSFEHQIGPFILGESVREEIKEKLMLRRDILRYQQSYWLQNGTAACRILRELASATNGTAELSALLEDGLFDEKIWLPAALFAELLWDDTTEYNRLLGKVARREIVETIG